jgi:hypothetical protein
MYAFDTVCTHLILYVLGVGHGYRQGQMHNTFVQCQIQCQVHISLSELLIFIQDDANERSNLEEQRNKYGVSILKRTLDGDGGIRGEKDRREQMVAIAQQLVLDLPAMRRMLKTHVEARQEAQDETAEKKTSNAIEDAVLEHLTLLVLEDRHAAKEHVDEELEQAKMAGAAAFCSLSFLILLAAPDSLVFQCCLG